MIVLAHLAALVGSKILHLAAIACGDNDHHTRPQPRPDTSTQTGDQQT